MPWPMHLSLNSPADAQLWSIILTCLFGFLCISNVTAPYSTSWDPAKIVQGKTLWCSPTSPGYSPVPQRCPLAFPTDCRTYTSRCPCLVLHDPFKYPERPHPCINSPTTAVPRGGHWPTPCPLQHS